MQVPFETEAEGCQWLANHLRGSAVLLVLDDIWRWADLRHLDFATMLNCCHSDSRLIVTTRDRGVLKNEQGHEIDSLRVTELEFLTDENSILLLCHHAFGYDQAPPQELEGVVHVLAAECKGLPLALQVLGASLRDTSVRQWQELIDKLHRIDPTQPQTQQIMARCKPSYDALPPHLQQCFLDLAAYPEDTRVPADELIALWATRAPFMTPPSVAAARGQLAQLTQRSLVKLIELPGVEVCYMHDILRDIAVVEARASNECAYAAGVAQVPQGIVPQHKFLPWRPIAACMPRGVRIQLCASASVKRVSLHSNKLAAECWEQALPSIRMLHMQNCSAASMPPALASLTALRVLSLARVCNMRRLPKGVGELLMLNVLDLSGCSKLKALPESIGGLVALQTLNLTECSALAALPESICGLTALQQLHLSGCTKLAALPNGIGGLAALQTLGLSLSWELVALPESIGRLATLQTLGLIWCSALLALPDSIGKLTALQTLLLNRCTSLAGLPDSIGNLTALQTLLLSGCSSLAALPDSIGNLTALQILHLHDCDALRALPESIGKLTALQTLHVSNRYNNPALKALLDSIGKLKGSIGEQMVLHRLILSDIERWDLQSDGQYR